MTWQAPHDVRETTKEVLIWIDMPGVDEDEISILRNGPDVEISVVRDFDHDQEDAEEFSVINRPFGEFRCLVTMPDNAQIDGMTAKYRRGVLKVRVPRKAQERTSAVAK